jgi:hypothetical protein
MASSPPAGSSVRSRALLVLLAVALIVSAIVLFAEYRGAPSGCTHGIASPGPVTIGGGKVNVAHKTYAKACLL